MTANLAHHIEQSVSEALPTMEGSIDKLKAIKAEARRMQCIPQGYTFMDELAAIHKLLTLGRAQEAKTRLEITLDRNMATWRGCA